jgi:hypothetical protein
LRLEEEDGAVPEVEIDEVFRLMRDKTAKVPSYYTVPCCSLARVELFLDVLSDVLESVSTVQCTTIDIRVEYISPSQRGICPSPRSLRN